MTCHNTFVAELLRIGAYLQREGGRVTRQHGLSQQHFVVLKTVQELGPTPQKKIVSELLYEKSNVSKAITNLRERGLVTVRKSEEDSRILLCSVTKSGLGVIEESMRAFDAWNREWVRHVPEDELKQVCSMLRGLGRK